MSDLAHPAFTEDNRPYAPQGAIKDVFAANDDELLVEGPAGTGKTIALLTLAFVRAVRYPNSRQLLLRQTRASLTQSVLVTWEQRVVPKGHPCLEGPGRPLRESYKFPNGAEVVVGGLDKPERTFSTEYDAVYLFEATEASEDALEMLLRALRHHRMPMQQLLCDCNPAGPNHWLNQRAMTPKMRRVRTTHRDNPLLWDAKADTWTKVGGKYLETLSRMSGHRRARLLEGKWVQAEGVVYDDFDASIHVITRAEYAQRVTQPVAVYRAIDFGYKNPFVCQWWALAEDGALYLFREVYRTGMLVEDAAREIKGLSAGVSIAATVADHDAEGRATLLRHGIQTTAARKDIVTGVQAVQARLRGDGLYFVDDALYGPDGDLAASGRPTRTTEEFESYVYPKDQSGRSVKELPVKRDDHGMDAMRYLVAHVDGVSRASARTVGVARPRRVHHESTHAMYARLRNDPDWGFDD